jgi:hypothetical protein
LQTSLTGRKDKGQEAVIQNESLQTRVEELIRLKKAADTASDDYAAAIKKCAEDSGLLSATVRKFVDARAGDKFDDAKTKVLQLALVFDEVGINS